MKPQSLNPRTKREIWFLIAVITLLVVFALAPWGTEQEAAASEGPAPMPLAGQGGQTDVRSVVFQPGSEARAASVAPRPAPQQGSNVSGLALTVLPSGPAQPPEPTVTPVVEADERDQELIDITPVKLSEEDLGALTPPPCDLHA